MPKDSMLLDKLESKNLKRFGVVRQNVLRFWALFTENMKNLEKNPPMARNHGQYGGRLVTLCAQVTNFAKTKW